MNELRLRIKLEGKQARLQVVDQFSQGWGNIGIDDIVFTDTAPTDAGGDLETQRDFGTMTLALIGDGGLEAADRAGEGALVAVVTEATPFYGESGGQIGDTGTITGLKGAIEVTDTAQALLALAAAPPIWLLGILGSDALPALGRLTALQPLIERDGWTEIGPPSSWPIAHCAMSTWWAPQSHNWPPAYSNHQRKVR